MFALFCQGRSSSLPVLEIGWYRPSRTPTLPVLQDALDGIFGLMSEQALVNLNNNSWSSKHQWGVNIDDSPTANIPQILVCLYGTLLSYLGLLGSITNGILSYPPKHQHHPLFQGQFRFFKETPIPQTQRLSAVRVRTPPPLVHKLDTCPIIHATRLFC